jgi:hypothetical protein
LTMHFSPKQIMARIRTDERAGRILLRLCAYHPQPVSRRSLMEGAGILYLGRVSAQASFHWHVERLNDELRPLGWQITGGHQTNEMYRLESA